jgi:hypothetical protein
MTEMNESTRIALASAFEGRGLPTNVFPDLDIATLDLYVGERALAIFNQLPRNVRRANGDVVVTALVRGIGLGFWSGATFVVERDRG